MNSDAISTLSKIETIGHRLHRAVQAADSILERHSGAVAVSVTARQLALLVALSREGGLSQTQLTRATGIDRSTMTDMIRRLCAQGLVQRKRRKQDARAYELRLTEQGSGVVDRAGPALARSESELLDVLPSEHREKLDVSRADRTLKLTAKELAILELLMSAPGKLFSRERILSNGWGISEDPLTNVVDVYIGRLRRQLSASGEPQLIETVRGMGYRLTTDAAKRQHRSEDDCNPDDR